MKNVSFSINPFSTPTLFSPSQSPPVPALPKPDINYTVAFSVQFEDAEKAMMFAKVMLQTMQNYGE